VIPAESETEDDVASDKEARSRKSVNEASGE
jgi:hypothetical protein